MASTTSAKTVKRMIEIWDKFDTYTALGKELGITGVTVDRWRERLEKQGINLSKKTTSMADVLKEIAK